MTKCEHADQVNRNVQPSNVLGCEECLKKGDKFVAVRVCLTCGHTGCCDSSRNRHARKHFEETRHPIIRPMEGEDWEWCYVDNTYIA